MPGKYLDPTNDCAFKKLFQDKERMMDLLNNFLITLNRPKIVDLHYLSVEEVPIYPTGKKSIFDLRVKDETGKTYIVEMQRKSSIDYIDRVQYYAAHAYATQLKKEIHHIELLPVVVISIVGNKLFPDDIDCINEHTTVERKTGRQYLTSTEYIFVELGKFDTSKLDNDINGWLHLFTCAEDEKIPPKVITNKNILSAYETLEQGLWSDGEYDAYIRARLDMEAEEIKIETAVKEAVQEAIEKEREKSELEKIDIARQLLSLGVTDTVILESTKISKEDLNALKKT